MTEDNVNISDREFVALITANQRRIYAYILTLQPNKSDADDIMQDTTAYMWEKKHHFTPGTDFVAWGVRIAYFKVLDYRKKLNKNRCMICDDDKLASISNAAFEQSKKVEETLSKLEDCIKKLSNTDRLLVNMKYTLEFSIKEISAQINKSIRSIYFKFAKIQGLLLQCLERGGE